MKNLYTVVIVDDDETCLSNLQHSLLGFSDVVLSGTASTPQEGIKIILEQQPDLLFLDVELPGMTGFDILRQLRCQINWPIQVVFYTAYAKYLLEALRESAFDYLLKPYEPDELNLVMNRFFDHASPSHTAPTFDESFSRLLPEKQTFMISTVTGFQVLRLEQIGYFEYIKTRKLWSVVLFDGNSLQLKRNTSAEDILKYSTSFVQINQQQIININYLSIINGKECVLFPPFENNHSLTISRGCLKFIQEKLNFI